MENRDFVVVVVVQFGDWIVDNIAIINKLYLFCYWIAWMERYNCELSLLCEAKWVTHAVYVVVHNNAMRKKKKKSAYLRLV